MTCYADNLSVQCFRLPSLDRVPLLGWSRYVRFAVRQYQHCKSNCYSPTPLAWSGTTVCRLPQWPNFATCLLGGPRLPNLCSCEAHFYNVGYPPTSPEGLTACWAGYACSTVLYLVDHIESKRPVPSCHSRLACIIASRLA